MTTGAGVGAAANGFAPGAGAGADAVTLMPEYGPPGAGAAGAKCADADAGLDAGLGAKCADADAKGFVAPPGRGDPGADPGGDGPVRSTGVAAAPPCLKLNLRGDVLGPDRRRADDSRRPWRRRDPSPGRSAAAAA